MHLGVHLPGPFLSPFNTRSAAYVPPEAATREVYRPRGAEERKKARAAGFARVEAYGDLGGSAYDHEARRLVMLAVR